MFVAAASAHSVFRSAGENKENGFSPCLRKDREVERGSRPFSVLLPALRAVTCLKNVRTVDINIMDCQMSSLWFQEIQRQNRIAAT